MFVSDDVDKINGRSFTNPKPRVQRARSDADCPGSRISDRDVRQAQRPCAWRRDGNRINRQERQDSTIVDIGVVGQQIDRGGPVFIDIKQVSNRHRCIVNAFNTNRCVGRI